MSLSPSNILKPQVWIPIGLVVGILFAYGCRAFDSGPGVVPFRKQVFSLNPSNVQAIEIERGEVNGSPGQRHLRKLSREEIEAFLTLVGKTREYQPNHPEARAMYWVQVFSTAATEGCAARVIGFEITDTTNNGTYMQLWSQGSHGNNYGAFRNDEVKPFLEQVFDTSSKR